MNESINGRVEVATIDFSVMGTAVLNKVVLYNKAGAQAASSDEIGITYKFDDLLGGRFGIDSVKTVTAEKVRLKLGIDKKRPLEPGRPREAAKKKGLQCSAAGSCSKKLI